MPWRGSRRSAPHLAAALAIALAGCGGGGTPAPAPAAAPLVPLAKIDPSIQQDIRYAGPDNFTGAPVPGYEAPVCLLTEPAARALAAVQADLAADGFGLLVLDCYRPQRAVDRFVRWTREPVDPRLAALHHPNVPRTELVARGYLAPRSAHSRGSAVDVTLVRFDTWGGAAPVEMGTPFDFFDPRSATDSPDVSDESREMRRLLRDAMVRRGFRNLPAEWWHFALEPDPLPDRSFDVPVR